MEHSNATACSCPKERCPNHGACRACVIKHRDSDSLPYCLFPDNGGDKSNRNRYRVLKQRFENNEHQEDCSMALFGKKPAAGCCGRIDAEGMEKAEAAKAGGASVKILGTGCAKCSALEAATRAALLQLGMDASIDHVRDFAQIAAYGVMTTPALVVDGRVVSLGKVLKTEEVAALLQNVRGETK